MTVRAAGWVRVNSASMRLCSQAVAAFMARFAKWPPNTRPSSSGRSRRDEEEPITALSKRGARAKAGMVKRALLETGTRGQGGENGNIFHGSTTATNA